MTEQITETGDVSTDRNTESVSTESRTSDVGSSSDNTDDADDDLSTTVESSEEELDTFPRPYVVKLRSENARYRERARNADTYAKRLHTELVRATGKLADPSDLDFSEDHLDDPDTLAAALDDLLARKPHLASRRPIGEIGQGASPASSTVDLAALLRQRAR
jgi:hypothetical protein